MSEPTTPHAEPATDCDTDTDAEPMLAVYRHDVHKLMMRSHTAARDRVAGVRVNEQVPLGADRDAALLSRPRGEPEQTVANHESPFRLSLLTGDTAVNPDQTDGDIERAVRELVQIEDPTEMHDAWLTASLPAQFTESVYYPYTSIKYHTLLAAALLSNYRAGASFEDLCLVVDDAHDDPVSHRTILHTDYASLRLTASPGNSPAASLGPAPARSWADVWSRLPDHPFLADTSRRSRNLDAQLRRIRSWSTALQFIEDFELHAQRKAGGL
ncbi:MULTISPECIES: hypothetical protein [Haloarcula]|uniref:hypothetical protein n=1 Tax=Haloarcula TaxID=2237 RepID=UPI0023ECC5E7|nr:hypothetical protein [Halomicroarcula sp. XH51]